MVGPGAIDIFGLGGMVLVEGLHLVPIVFLLMAAAFATIDPALEESALTSGARLPSVVRRVSLPLVRPALAACVLIVVIRALEAFEVPALLGIPGGVWVFTSRIWRELNAFPADLGQAGAYALSLLALTAVGVFLLSRLSTRRRRFETVTGRGGVRPRRAQLGRWRWPVAVARVRVPRRRRRPAAAHARLRVDAALLLAADVRDPGEHEPGQLCGRAAPGGHPSRRAQHRRARGGNRDASC